MSATPGQGFAFEVGQVIGAASARLEEKFTEPPKRYTQDALIDDMLGAHKFAQSDADRNILKTTEGLGTSRTREPTITGLINRGLLMSQKKGKLHEIISTGPARQIISVLPRSLTDVVTTAKWEAALGMIQRGEVPGKLFLEKLTMSIRTVVDEAKSSDRLSLGEFPSKGKPAGNHSASSRGTGGSAKSR